MTKDEMQTLQAMFEASEQRMASMMDDKLAGMATKDDLEQGLAAVRTEIGDVEKRMTLMMDEKLAANNEALMQKVNASMDEKLAANNEVLVDRVNVIVENKYDEILKLLREDYTPVREKVAEFSDYPQIKGQVADHDRALKTQRIELDELKRKAI